MKSIPQAAGRVMVVIIALVAVACERPVEPSPLIANLSSGLGKAAVVQRLGPLAAEAREEEPQEINGGASAGGVTVERLRVPGYRHLDHEGELTLIFYNNQLATAIFRPADPSGYENSLSKEYSNDFTQSRQVQVEPNTTVWYTTNKQEGSFAGWEDREMMNRYDTYTER